MIMSVVAMILSHLAMILFLMAMILSEAGHDSVRSAHRLIHRSCHLAMILSVLDDQAMIMFVVAMILSVPSTPEPGHDYVRQGAGRHVVISVGRGSAYCRGRMAGSGGQRDPAQKRLGYSHPICPQELGRTVSIHRGGLSGNRQQHRRALHAAHCLGR